jgi:surfeit locus 1 family protein
MVKARNVVLITFAVIVAAVCVSLGVWQLRRLAERKAFNRTILSRIDVLPVDASTIIHPDSARFQRVVLHGRYDYDNEIVLMMRSRNGSPGVNIVTPLLVRGRDTAILVNRGWVYSPDAQTVDLARWREPVNAGGAGYVEIFPRREGTARSQTHPNAYRWLDQDALRGRIPYPVAAYYVVSITPGPVEKTPARLTLPDLDEGPHLSYAIQWFSFAAISIIGTIVLTRQRNGGESARAGQ